ncbi:MAG: DEAD/DEAH box helicase, partial [Microcystaceae cyanobacterium]
MATLHGSWLIKPDRNYWFLWAEGWQEKGDRGDAQDAIHPFCLNQAELENCLLLNHFSVDKNKNWGTEQINLPSKVSKKLTVPLLSGQHLEDLKNSDLCWQNWQVSGLCLKAESAITFFSSLPLGENTVLGQDIQFFAHLYRWSLDLLARQKFLPSLEAFEKGYMAQWFPLLDSCQDQTRLAQFSQWLPEICLAYSDNSVLKNNENLSNSSLILDFLQQIIQTQICQNLPKFPPIQNPPLPNWTKALSKFPPIIPEQSYALQKLATAIQNWQIPVQDFLGNPKNLTLNQSQFRLVLILATPPAQTELWRLDYALQALDNADWLLTATTIWQGNPEKLIWQGRTVENPQEILLTGLGFASQFYAPIALSLEESLPTGCNLDPIQVFEFIKASAWQLQEQGLGVIVPPSLAQGTTEKRLGLKLTGEVTPKKGERLTLHSLLNYQLKLAIGDQEISPQDFQNLLDQKSPLVEINGQWITLQPMDVRAAQNILNQNQEPLNLSVEDALRIHLGDSKTVAKLPILSFEASGILKELIANLSHNQGIEPIENPPGFKGELRPYQAKGVGWLAFLEKWGLGSCLADDMGLGKTPQLLAFLLHLKAQTMLEKPVLIVCPTSVINNWAHEIQKFAPSLSFHIHHGDKRSQGKDFSKNIAQKLIVLTSYSLLDRDSKTLTLIDWQGIVLDEAQNIKNAQSKQAQAVRKLNANFRIALTGTPVENRLTELWAILDFLNPAFLGTQTFFQRRFATPIEKFGDRASLQILRSLVRPFILRRLKTDTSIIQDLPEKQEMTVFCGLSIEQANLYQQLVDKSLQEIDDSTGIQRRGLI